MLLDACADGEDVWIEDYVLREETDLVHQDSVGAIANLDPSVNRIGLALLVEGHDDHRRAIPAHDAGLLYEASLPSFRDMEFTTPLPCRH